MSDIECTNLYGCARGSMTEETNPCSRLAPPLGSVHYHDTALNRILFASDPSGYTTRTAATYRERSARSTPRTRSTSSSRRSLSRFLHPPSTFGVSLGSETLIR